MKMVRMLSVWVAISAVILAGCSPAALSLAALSSLPVQTTSVPTPVPADIPVTGAAPLAVNSALSSFQDTFAQVYSFVSPSVVNIQVLSSTSGLSGFGRRHPSTVQEALGSGFIWDSQGHIVTNNHVITDASAIAVTFADGTNVEAKLVGADPNSDLAVLQVATTPDELKPALMGNSDEVRVGQVAIAIGSPFGLTGTMTEGIISGLARSLPVDISSNPFSSGPTYSIPDIIQTDAAINPGNSGGVLVNAQGQVLGVTTAIQTTGSANSGVGFVIPAAIVSRVVPVLIQTGKFDHPYLGAYGDHLSAALVAAMHLPAGQRGALISDIDQGSPAEQAGLQASATQAIIAGQPFLVGGDVITAVDGNPVTSFDDLNSYLFDQTRPGQTVTLTLLRQGSQKTVPVKLGVLQ